MEKDVVIFYAPTGLNTPNFKIGGAESGCRKTLEILKKAHKRVILVEKPFKKSDSFFAKLSLCFALLKTLVKTTFHIICHRNSTLHIAGFYLDQVYMEFILFTVSKIFRIRSVYEIRNGGMIQSYNNRGKLYSFCLNILLSKSTKVLCQGQDYVEFISHKFDKSTIYYPNYVMDDFVMDLPRTRSSSSVLKLVFVGRVVPAKNIEFLIDVCNEVHKLGYKYEFSIIGGVDSDYYDQIQDKIKELGLKKSAIIFTGRLEGKELFDLIGKQHYFLFPTQEPREGHSNALTEAMSLGVVPIASNHGFNASVTGNIQFIIDDYSAFAYAACIHKIEAECNWIDLSNEVRLRIIDSFTENKVSEQLLFAYN